MRGNATTPADVALSVVVAPNIKVLEEKTNVCHSVDVRVAEDQVISLFLHLP